MTYGLRRIAARAGVDPDVISAAVDLLGGAPERLRAAG